MAQGVCRRKIRFGAKQFGDGRDPKGFPSVENRVPTGHSPTTANFSLGKYRGWGCGGEFLPQHLTHLVVANPFPATYAKTLAKQFTQTF
jgi:hypothetical protein